MTVGVAAGGSPRRKRGETTVGMGNVCIACSSHPFPFFFLFFLSCFNCEWNGEIPYPQVWTKDTCKLWLRGAALMGGEEAWGSSSIPYPLPIDPKFGETGTRSRNPRFDQGLPRCTVAFKKMIQYGICFWERMTTAELAFCSIGERSGWKRNP
jgi:hypothetical protein